MQTIAVDMQNKIGEAIRNSPAKDIEKNVRAMMSQGFQRMDLVTREEFDIQSRVLAKTREKLEALEAKVAEQAHKQAMQAFICSCCGGIGCSDCNGTGWY